MRIYRVGGAVRDALLGLPVHDEDWVVVGATPEQMVAAGYLPVGKDFPVFLHPESREEYALARTERKTAPGYHGFVFHTASDVTLEQDLARRDLTINAIAQGEDGVLIDPYRGQADLRAGVLRHVTDAFREDPVRILRVARFAARFERFHLAPETLELMRAMVRHGEADALVAERVWQELARGLMEPRPSRMLDVLRECGALARVLPEIESLFGVPRPDDAHPGSDSGLHLMNVLDAAAVQQAPLPVRFAGLTQDLAPALLQGLCQRLRVPNDCRELAEVVGREQGAIHGSLALDAPGLVQLLERCDAFRKPQRFEEVLLACECDVRGLPGGDEAPYPQRRRLHAALRAALHVKTAQVAAQAAQEGLHGPAVGERIQQARIAAVARKLAADR